MKFTFSPAFECEISVTLEESDSGWQQLESVRGLCDRWDAHRARVKEREADKAGPRANAEQLLAMQRDGLLPQDRFDELARLQGTLAELDELEAKHERLFWQIEELQTKPTDRVMWATLELAAGRMPPAERLLELYVFCLHTQHNRVEQFEEALPTWRAALAAAPWRSVELVLRRQCLERDDWRDPEWLAALAWRVEGVWPAAEAREA